MSYSADSIANGLLERAEAEGVELTNLQLQKLVFFCHAWNFGFGGEVPLVDEPVEAWRHGPVFRSLYDEFKHFGKGPVRSRAQDFSFDTASGKLQIVYPTIAKESVSSAYKDEYVDELLSWVWSRYAGLNPFDLVRITHADGEPWRIVKDQYPELPRGLHIPNPLIRECYRKKAAELNN